ncbi:MAG TPA: hypothetical protein VJG32_00820 [Anaerolineae bacterium]|nr:hypothetical protein [Anaerolineae bacterium]
MRKVQSLFFILGVLALAVLLPIRSGGTASAAPPLGDTLTPTDTPVASNTPTNTPSTSDTPTSTPLASNTPTVTGTPPTVTATIERSTTETPGPTPTPVETPLLPESGGLTPVDQPPAGLELTLIGLIVLVFGFAWLMVRPRRAM